MPLKLYHLLVVEVKRPQGYRGGEEFGLDPEDVPWKFGGRVRMLAVHEYLNDDEDEGWKAGNVGEGELEA